MTEAYPYNIPAADRSRWEPGQWDAEPDRTAWIEPETGYACCAMRDPEMGNWLGYVRVPPESLLAGLDKDDRVTVPPAWLEMRFRIGDDIGVLDVFCEAFGEEKPGRPVGMLLAVHGGITYCRNDWWGFDCGHAGDHQPGMWAIVSQQYRDFFRGKLIYRTLEYVRHECNQLAWQLKELDAAMRATADAVLGEKQE